MSYLALISTWYLYKQKSYKLSKIERFSKNQNLDTLYLRDQSSKIKKKWVNLVFHIYLSSHQFSSNSEMITSIFGWVGMEWPINNKTPGKECFFRIINFFDKRLIRNCTQYILVYLFSPCKTTLNVLCVVKRFPAFVLPFHCKKFLGKS